MNETDSHVWQTANYGNYGNYGNYLCHADVMPGGDAKEDAQSPS